MKEITLLKRRGGGSQLREVKKAGSQAAFSGNVIAHLLRELVCIPQGREVKNHTLHFLLHPSLKRKAAFTLAEVLITLGIIGIVAALTMPSLIVNYRKQSYVVQLKKTFSVVAQAISLSKAHDGVSDFVNTNFYKLLDSNASLDEVTNEAKKYLSIVKSCKGYTCNLTCKALNGTACGAGPYIWPSDYIYTFYLNDGSVIGINAPGSYNGLQYDGLIDIVVDVNGEKLPNQYGRDIFRLALDTQDKVVPWESSGTGKGYLNGADGDPCMDAKTDHGWACAQRIMAEGWKMNY